MERIIKIAVRLIQAWKRAYEKRWVFLIVTLLLFCLSVFLLGKLDLLPNASSIPATVAEIDEVAIATSSEPVQGVMAPVRVAIPAINLSATVANPTTTAVDTLDGLLLKGAVRYPTSALLGEAGNVVLFGHSSYLPIVGNQAYKTFDGIQKLVAGDVITVYATGVAYTYQVRSVAKESAASDAGIALATTDRVLTLVTCNSFATKTDRFIVTADFVESHVISS